MRTRVSELRRIATTAPENDCIFNHSCAITFSSTAVMHVTDRQRTRRGATRRRGTAAGCRGAAACPGPASTCTPRGTPASPSAGCSTLHGNHSHHRRFFSHVVYHLFRVTLFDTVTTRAGRLSPHGYQVKIDSLSRHTFLTYISCNHTT